MNSVTAYGLDTFDQEAGRGFEEPKVALKRKIPASELFVHFIAVGAIVFLGWACVRQKYWKDLDFKNNSWLNVYLRAWQLGAKAHELFMIASLSFIVFYHTRRLLIGPNGIPFGLLISPFTSNSPGMLFHRYFWNAVTRNRTFGVLLGFVCIFSVIIGPSSAITMIPSLNWFQLSEAELPGEIGWPNGGESIHFLAEPDLLWPTTLNASKDLESTKDTPQACASQPFDYDLFLGCPVSGFATILKWVRSLND